MQFWFGITPPQAGCSPGERIWFKSRGGDQGGSAQRVFLSFIVLTARKDGKCPAGMCDPAGGDICGCSSMAEHQPSKLAAWVRFPSPAPGPAAEAAPGCQQDGPPGRKPNALRVAYILHIQENRVPMERGSNLSPTEGCFDIASLSTDDGSERREVLLGPDHPRRAHIRSISSKVERAAHNRLVLVRFQDGPPGRKARSVSFHISFSQREEPQPQQSGCGSLAPKRRTSL